jgi:hypothetical protein
MLNGRSAGRQAITELECRDTHGPLLSMNAIALALMSLTKLHSRANNQAVGWPETSHL